MYEWFNERRVAGYDQIQKRLDYLERDPKLTREDINYEAKTIRYFLGLIPQQQDDTRKSYQERLEKILKNARKRARRREK